MEQLAYKIRTLLIASRIRKDANAINTIRSICLDLADFFEIHITDFDRLEFHKACGWD